MSCDPLTRSIPEEMKIYSASTKIYVKKLKKNEKSKSGRKFDSVHACCFRSKKLYTNIQAHLEGHVKEENEMKHIQTLKEMKTTCDNEKKEIQKEILKKKNKKKKKKQKNMHYYGIEEITPSI